MKIEWKTCFRVGLSIFILYLCISYWKDLQELFGLIFSAAMPLIIGCAIAYPINILMAFYERHYFPKSQKKAVLKSRKAVCMIGAFLSFIAIIVLVISLVVPQLVSCIQLIIAELPDAMDYILARMEKLGIVPENIIRTLSAIDWKSRIGGILQALTSGVGNVMDVVMTTVSSVFSGIVTSVLSIIFAVYILCSKERLADQYKRLTKCYLPDKIRSKSAHIISLLNECFHCYIVGQCTEAVILGLLCTIGMLILRLPYATMIGALVAFTALIPIAGAYIGAIVGAFMILMVSPVQALIFIIFILILQQVEGNLIYPKVVGSSIGLPGIWVLAAVTVGGGIMGVFGMLLGVPIAACVYRLISEDVKRKA